MKTKARFSLDSGRDSRIIGKMIFKLLRKYVKTFLWILAVLIIPSFILWGVGSGIREHRRAQEAGRLFGKRVSWDDYETSYRTVEIFLSLSGFQSYAQFLNPVELAWDRLILLQEVKKRRMTVPDQEVIDYIQSIPAFRSAGGSDPKEGAFDQKRYEEILHRAFRTTPRSFEEEVRKTLLLGKLREAVTSEVALDDKTVKEEYHKIYDKRKVSYIEFAIRPFEKEVAVTEEILTPYYASHRDTFDRPEEVRVAFVTADFEKRSKEEAVAVMDKLSDELFATSEELKKVAETHGFSLQETGFFALEDPLPAPGFSFELSQAAFQLQVGQTSEPIQTESGVTILKLLEKRAPRTLSFEEAKDAVEKMVRREEAEILCRRTAHEALQALQKKMREENVSWEDAVKELGTLNETPFFTLEGSIEKVGEAPEFARAAFTLKLREVGGVVKTPNGFSILRLEAEEPASDEAFVKEKEAFREKLLRQKQAVYYLEWFQVLRANARLVSNIERPQNSPSP